MQSQSGLANKVQRTSFYGQFPGCAYWQVLAVWVRKKAGCWLLTSYQPRLACGAVVLNCYHTDGYESSTLQGSADISPRLHPRALIPINSEWTGRGYKLHLPLPIIDYWPASAGSNMVWFNLSTLGVTVAPIHVESSAVEAARSQADTLNSVCVSLCWCLLKRLLQESLVIHGCSEERASPHYGCRNPGFCSQWGEFKKLS